MFSSSLSVSLYETHTRTSLPHSIHRHVLHPFALPRRVIAFTSRRAPHVCRNSDLIDKIALSLCASLNTLSQSCCFELSLLTQYIHRTHVTNAASITINICAENFPNASSLPLIRASTTLPPFAVAIKSRAICTGFACAAVSAISGDVSVRRGLWFPCRLRCRCLSPFSSARPCHEWRLGSTTNELECVWSFQRPFKNTSRSQPSSPFGRRC